MTRLRPRLWASDIETETLRAIAAFDDVVNAPSGYPTPERQSVADSDSDRDALLRSPFHGLLTPTHSTHCSRDPMRHQVCL